MTVYLNASNAAAELGITTTSLYKIINHSDANKRLNPVNRDTYKGDGGFMFRQEDVDRIKPSYVRKDLTSAEAAKQIGRSTTYIHKLIREGVLPYYEGELRGKRTYFITETDLKTLVASNPETGKYDTIYDKKSSTFLFQPYRREGRFARIVSMKRLHRSELEITLQLGADEFLAYDEAIQVGWKPMLSITEKKPITTFGYALFEFPVPETLDSMIFTIIEEMFKQIGPSNIRINAGDRLIVEVKKSVLLGVLPTTHPDLIDKLKLFIRSGHITTKYDGTLIDTGLSPITIYLPEEKKANLIRKAEESNKSLQDWLEDHLSLL